jgi:hypothetical protein
MFRSRIKQPANFAALASSGDSSLALCNAHASQRLTAHIAVYRGVLAPGRLRATLEPCGGPNVRVAIWALLWYRWAREHTWMRFETCAIALRHCTQAHKLCVLLNVLFAGARSTWYRLVPSAPCIAVDHNDLRCELSAGARSCKRIDSRRILAQVPPYSPHRLQPALSQLSQPRCAGFRTIQ